MPFDSKISGNALVLEIIKNSSNVSKRVLIEEIYVECGVRISKTLLRRYQERLGII